MRTGKRKFHAENQALDGHFHKKYSKKVNSAERQSGKQEIRKGVEEVNKNGKTRK